MIHKYFTKLSVLSFLIITASLNITPINPLKPKSEASLAEKLNIAINPKTLTVSGISSGGYMAGQFHLAHSAHIKGAAIFSAGPYFCSQGKADKLTKDCMANPENLDLDFLQGVAKQHEELGFLDSLENLKDSKVFVFIGLKDSRVLPGVSEKLRDFYLNFQVKEIKTEISPEAEHAFPTDNQANNPCGFLGFPFINYCGYPGALSALKFIGNPESFAFAEDRNLSSEYENKDKGKIEELEKLKKIKNKENKENKHLNYKLENLIEFSQSFYFSNEKVSMNEKGFIYIPDQCKNKQKLCDLHVVFHGCRQTLDHIQTQFMEKAGYLEVAEEFGIVMLFPQTIVSEQDPVNPNGCWDFWGYNKPFELKRNQDRERKEEGKGDEDEADNSYFGTKKGKQVAAVWNIVKDLTGIHEI